MALPWFLGPLNPKKMHWSTYLFVYVGVFLVFWNIGLREYAQQYRYYSCRSKQAYGVPANRYPNWCQEFDLIEPHRRSTRKIFSHRERIAIRIHHLTELVFLRVLGFTERSRTGWKMYRVRSPVEGLEFGNMGERRRLCTDKGHLGGETQLILSDFAMSSPYVRNTIATQIPELDDLHHWQNEESKLLFYNNNHPLQALIAQDSLHVGSTLQNNSSLFAKLSKDQKHLNLSIQSSVYYSTTTIDKIMIPTLFGEQLLPIDNAMYCGLTMDGWLRPYFQQWNWQIPIRDPRIHDRGVEYRSIDSREEFAISFLKRYLASSKK